jgi:predicted nucleotidyltransferase
MARSTAVTDTVDVEGDTERRITFLDVEAIRRACDRYGVERLRVFGSVLTDRFDPETSDVDFLVAFRPGRENVYHDYFDLKFELERIVGRAVDLVVERSVKNPFFRASAFANAQDIYAA